MKQEEPRWQRNAEQNKSWQVPEAAAVPPEKEEALVYSGSTLHEFVFVTVLMTMLIGVFTCPNLLGPLDSWLEPESEPVVPPGWKEWLVDLVPVSK